jgi:hypothetical protein
MDTRPRFLVLLTMLLAGCASSSADPATPPPAPSWEGIYDLIGSGFPEGDRAATLVITRPDTGYAATLQGPPGQMAEFRIGRDSLSLIWDLQDGTAPFQVRLGRTATDSVTGTWTSGVNNGFVRGMRRPLP